MRFRFGECVLNDQSREILRAGEPVRVTPKAFELLTLLLRERPRAVPKSELHDRLWPDTFVAESNLPSLMKEVRTAVAEPARAGRHLRTVHGFGYAFCGTAEEIEGDDTQARSIAFFPFESPEADPELRYVADGLPESLINTFSRFPDFRVTPRSTAFRLTGLANDFVAMRARLDVRWAVTGRVSVVNGDLTVQVDLVDTATGAQVWGERFRKETDGIAALDHEIARGIMRALVPLAGSDATPAVNLQTRNDDAFLLYLKGQFHWNRRTSGSLQRAIECFSEAVELDRYYVLPRVGLAEAWVTVGSRDFVDPSQAFAHAERHATAALKLNPELAEVHTVLAAIDEVHHWDWTGAERRHQRAISLEPNHATVMQWYALHLGRLGKHEEARHQIERAAGLDPLSLIINTNRGLLAYMRRDYLAALDIYERVLELDPHFEGALIGKALALDMTGERNAAAQVFEALLELSPEAPHVLGFYVHSLASDGRSDEASALLARLEALRSTRYVSGACMAVALIGMGRLDDAIGSLRVAVERKSAWLVYLLTEPRLDPLRGDERFDAILERINLRSAAAG